MNIEMRVTMKRTNCGTKLIVFILSMVMVLSLTACGNGSSELDPSKESTAQESTTPPATDNEALKTLFFTSDYQEETGWAPPGETLGGLISAVKNDGKEIDEFILCGDYTNDRVLHDYQISPDDSISEIKGIIQRECPELTSENIIFTQGNHDHWSESFSTSGLHEYENYLVYVLNTENDFPWKQGKVSGSLDKVKKTAKEMNDCFTGLIESGETRPIIIAGHVPLHFTGRTSSLHTTGDNLYSSLLFKVINSAGKSLDITFLFGHNHTKGWDCYLGQSCVFKLAGDEILIPKFSESDLTTDEYMVEKLTFTYMNAGYVGHCMNCSPNEVDAGTVDQYEAADDTLTATICEIYPDEVVYTRYSRDGVYQLSSAGCASPYFDDSKLIRSEYYSEQIDSPVAVTRKKDK